MITGISEVRACLGLLSVEQFKEKVTSVAIDQSRWYSTSKHLHLLEHLVVGCVLKYANQPYDYVTDWTTEKSRVRMQEEA